MTTTSIIGVSIGYVAVLFCGALFGWYRGYRSGWDAGSADGWRRCHDMLRGNGYRTDMQGVYEPDDAA